jgi:hypothetical protein
VFAVNSVVAVRPVVEFTSTAEAAERTPTDPRLPEDKVSLSPEAKRALDLDAGPDGEEGQGTKDRIGGPRRLDAEQEQQVAALKRRDAHVRQHEAAHQAAGGELTGSASFSYQTGPDGRSYAVGGEVPISARSGRTADETIAIARRVRAAALAPADPSPADLSAAAAAMQLEAKAQGQKRAEQVEESRGQAQQGPASGPRAGTLERVVMKDPEPPQIF